MLSIAGETAGPNWLKFFLITYRALKLKSGFNTKRGKTASNYRLI